MIYYFYKITNNINGKYYYGVHHTENINDGYMGSGVLLRRAYNKYGQSNFTKEIIRYFDNADDMFKYEAEIVNEDLVKDVNCYNIALGGFGGNLIAGLSEEEKKQLFYNRYPDSDASCRLVLTAVSFGKRLLEFLSPESGNFTVF